MALLVSTGQLACLLLGLGWFGVRLRSDLSETMRQDVLTSNRAMATQLAAVIKELNLEDIEYGSTGWSRLQDMVEQIRLPNDGFMCIVDRGDGQLLCHPDLRHKPELRAKQPGLATLQGPGLGRPIVELTGSSSAYGGWATMPDGTHLIGVQDVPSLGVKIMAHQRERGIVSAIDRVLGSVFAVGVAVSFVVTFFGFLVTWIIVGRYENRLMCVNAGLEQTVAERTSALVETRDAVIFGLAKLAESRDDDTGKHLERIRTYVELLATELGKTYVNLDAATVSTLGLTSALHDIGKVGIPDAVLLKPAPLSPDERVIIQRHTTIGGDCLLALKQRLGDDDFIEVACEIALAHHERWDGGGYPFGLKGDQIPFSARIVAVADVYDALTSERVYKRAMSHHQAVDIIRAGAGTQFDPVVVEAFESVCDQFEAVASHLHEEERCADRAEPVGV